MAVPSKKETSKSSTTADEAPDGGWGWVIVCSVVINNVIHFGHFRCFGLYVLHLMRLFNADASQVAWIISIQIGLANLFSPFGSSLIQLLGARKVALIGGCISCLSFALASVAQNLYVVYLTFGVGGALGIVCTFNPAIQTIGVYFSKRRGMANGLAMAGNSLGGIVIPPLMEIMLEEYGYRGTVLIMSGLFFNSCVCAMLWQPVEWHRRKDKKSDLFPNKPGQVDPVFNPHGIALVKFARRLSGSLSSFRLPRGALIDKAVGMMPLEAVAKWDPACKNDAEAKVFTISLPEEETGKTVPRKKILDLSLLRHPIFWVLTVCNTCCMVGYPVLLLFLPFRVQQELGYSPRDTASLLSVLALTDLFGRIVMSSISDVAPCSRSFWYTSGYLMTAASAFALPFCPNFTSIAIVIGAFGIFSGTFISITFSRVSDIFGGDRVAMVWGLVSLIGGLCGLGGPPAFGYVMDQTRSFMVCQSLTGCLFLIGGLSSLTEAFIAPCREAKKSKTPELRP